MRIVLYSQRVETIEKTNEKRDCIDIRVTQFIDACGFLPIAVPNNIDITKKIIKTLKPAGIVLTGGNSIIKYGGDSIEKDLNDHFLIEMAIQNKIPLYGFCRGMQSILDYFNNELVEVSNHVAVKHTISGEYEEKIVNSYHNQGCMNITSEELIAIMKSKDGVVEMIKHKDLPIIGTMWHPERENPYKEEDMNMLVKLIEEKKI